MSEISTKREQVKAGLRIAIPALGMVIAMSLGQMYQPGPWQLWTTDACRAPNVVCGQLAIGRMFAGILGGIIAFGLLETSIRGYRTVRA